MSNELQSLRREWLLATRVPLVLLVILWSVFLFDTLFLNGKLKSHGVHPRDIRGLMGILYGPFLHGSLAHIINNTIGIISLGSIVILRGVSKFAWVSIVSMITSGFGIWLVGGHNSNHIGFSGIIFGYFGYLLFSGIFDRKLGSILVTMFTGAVYGGMIFGVLPHQPGVSWEGHLFGLLGGIVSAFLLSTRVTKRTL